MTTFDECKSTNKHRKLKTEGENINGDKRRKERKEERKPKFSYPKTLACV
jgi:hypothetical protein